MKNSLLIVRQLDKKIERFSLLNDGFIPKDGWVSLIRKTLNMSLRQLGKRLSITPQSVRTIELREKEGTITLNTLKESAEALDLKFVYGFIPKDGSIEKMIEKKARALATKIVMRTSNTMKLEDQENSKERISQAIEEMTTELKKELSKKLWD